MNEKQIQKYTEYTNLKELKKAFLIASYFSNQEKAFCLDCLAELERLCETYGLEVIDKMPVSLKKVEAATYLGKGKLEEIKQLLIDKEIDVVIFDEEISPQQQRNLEAFWEKPVIDRTELIIEVFAQRAQTKEAKLQVELAKVRYQLPRLKRLWTHLSRQSGGGGQGAANKGEGEKQIEIDRRLIKHKIDQLQKEIKDVRAVRQTQRLSRTRSLLPTVAIVGYTNVGKSTLLKALTTADVLVEDKLFATLDTTTRRYLLPNNQEVLLIDTVGFIRKIPHLLVAAFKSTLEEVLYTDLLVHLIDGSHPMATLQAEETMKVLKEMNALDRPVLTIINKIDQCHDKAFLIEMRKKYPDLIEISALTQQGFKVFTDRLSDMLSKLRKRKHLKIPQHDYALISKLREEAHILHIEYEENDVVLDLEIPHHLEHLIADYEETGQCQPSKNCHLQKDLEKDY
ncbi:MAG: GTPase HflX [Rhabdochlamydiaceae bacterium]